jgi:hypothetical protein
VTPCFLHFGQLPSSQSNPCIRICQYRYRDARYGLQCKKPQVATSVHDGPRADETRGGEFLAEIERAKPDPGVVKTIEAMMPLSFGCSNETPYQQALMDLSRRLKNGKQMASRHFV